MTTCKDWFSFSVAAVLLAFSGLAGAQEKLEVSVEPQVIQPGLHAVLTIRLPKSDLIKRLATENGVSATIQDDLLTKKKEVQLINKEFREDKDAYVWIYQFTGYRPGKIQLPPVEVQFGPFSLSTETKTLEISTSRKAGDEELRAEFGLVRPPFPWRIWFKWIAIAIFGGGATALIIAFFPKAKAKPAPVAVVTETVSEEEPDVWLRKQLQLLREELNRETEKAEWVDALTEIVRQYFERLTKNPARSWTTQEFKTRLKENEKAQALGRVLERCDAFKFQRALKEGARELASHCLNDTEQVLL